MKKIVLLLFVSLIVSCTPLQSVEILDETINPSDTHIPTETPVPTQTLEPLPTLTASAIVQLTFTPTLTSTPQPPLTEHEWSPETVLILMRESLGDGGMSVGDLGPPPFILYADGSLFVTKTIIVDDRYQTQVLVKKLSKKEICQHLNTLDQIGYLDYDSSNYTFIGGEPYWIGSRSILITINAWKAKSDWYYDLAFSMDENTIRDLYGQNGYPIISTALRDVYYFLSKYPTDGFEVYKPDRLGVWIIPVQKIFFDTYGIQVKNWEFEKISLTSLINNAKFLPNDDYQKFIILNGQDAQLLYDYFGNLIGSDYFFIEDPKAKDGKKYYEVFVRPLLPYEMPSESYLSTIPATDSPKPNFNLTCSPSDGVLPIPMP